MAVLPAKKTPFSDYRIGLISCLIPDKKLRIRISGERKTIRIRQR
jgi:hypothetical protein